MTTQSPDLSHTAEAFALQWREQLAPYLQELGFQVQPLLRSRKLLPLVSEVTSSLRFWASRRSIHVNHRVSLWSRRKTLGSPLMYEAHLQLTAISGTTTLGVVASTVALGDLSGLDSSWSTAIALALVDPQSPLQPTALIAALEDCLTP